MTDSGNDNRDIDVMLREHGTTWRAANQHRPAIDWDEVTAPRRSWIWLAVAAVAVAAAAIVVPLAVVASNHTSKRVAPVHTPPPPAIARRGSPPGFFALTNGESAYVFPDGGYDGVRQHHDRPVAIGSAPNGLTSYSASPKSACRTSLNRLSYQPNWHHSGRFTNGPGFRIDGGALPVPMAISPDGSQLALVARQLRDSAGGGGAACSPTRVIEVVHLRSHVVHEWFAPEGALVQDLQWSSDSRHLAFALRPQPGGPTVYNATDPYGTHLLDVTATHQPRNVGFGNVFALEQKPTLLPLVDRDGQPYGPVFSSHGQWVTPYKDALWAVNDNLSVLKLGGPIGLPSSGTVTSVSSAADGNHLLLVVNGATYRWDRGLLSKVPGDWVQPSW